MNPYQIFAEAAKRHPDQSFLAVWNDFACWERARGFADDPNGPSKDDLDWIRQLYELAVRLEEMPGESQDCHNALEAAAAAFAGLDHEPQLCEAVRRWYGQRLEEEQSERESNPISS